MIKINDLCKIIGIESNIEGEVSGINSLEFANETELSYCIKDVEALKNTKAKVVLISSALIEYVPTNCIALICEDPKYSFALLSKVFSKDLIREGAVAKVSNTATIMPNVHLGVDVEIGDNTVIMSGAYIGDNVKIANNSIIYPNVVIYNDSIIGNNCIIHANTVIGSDGFGYASNKFGHTKIYHNGFVEIEDNVEIGACVCVDRAVFNKTIIKAGTKIDNLVQIGHNCEIGKACLVVSQAGLAGSSILGNGVIMGGQSATSGHLKIGDGAIVAARGGVTKSIDGGKVYGGFPIMEQKEWLKSQAKFKRMLNEN